MRVASRVCLAFLVFALFIGSMATSVLAGEGDPLFINMTTDDAHRANMAITFGKSQLDRGHPLTIFLNDKGVFLGSKTHISKFADHQRALTDIMAKGASVLICPMCMKHYGVRDADLVPGIKVGSPELTGGALFKDTTKTLTW